MIVILYQKGRCLLVFKIGFYEQRNIRVNQFTIHNLINAQFFASEALKR